MDKSHKNSVNKLNHSAAQLALITAQINSKKGTNFSLQDFLPYPEAQIKQLSIPEQVLGVVLMTKHKLPPSLLSIIEDPYIMSQLSATYYYKSTGFMYE